MYFVGYNGSFVGITGMKPCIIGFKRLDHAKRMQYMLRENAGSRMTWDSTGKKLILKLEKDRENEPIDTFNQRNAEIEKIDVEQKMVVVGMFGLSIANTDSVHVKNDNTIEMRVTNIVDKNSPDVKLYAELSNYKDQRRVAFEMLFLDENDTGSDEGDSNHVDITG